MWFIRSTSILWLTLTILTVCIVLGGQARTEPNQLQALGFGLCGDIPCVKGVKPGMVWRDAEVLAGERASGPPGNRWIYTPLGNREMVIRATRDNYRVAVMYTDAVSMSSLA